MNTSMPYYWGRPNPDYVGPQRAVDTVIAVKDYVQEARSDFAVPPQMIVLDEMSGEQVASYFSGADTDAEMLSDLDSYVEHRDDETVAYHVAAEVEGVDLDVCQKVVQRSGNAHIAAMMKNLRGVDVAAMQEVIDADAVGERHIGVDDGDVPISDQDDTVLRLLG